MEKYGTDLSNLPVDDDQIREIKKYAEMEKEAFVMPKNKKEAEEILEKFKAGEKNGHKGS
jgi:uncharacterized coiled-coil DUF342 family protein